MVTGHGYDYVVRMMGGARALRFGLTECTIDRMLGVLGFAVMRLLNPCRGGPWHPEPFAPVHLVRCMTAGDSGGHLVVMDELGVIYDPDRARPLPLAEWWGRDYITCVAGVYDVSRISVTPPTGR